MSIAVIILPIVLESIGPVKHDAKIHEKEEKIENKTKNTARIGSIGMGEYALNIDSPKRIPGIDNVDNCNSSVFLFY